MGFKMGGSCTRVGCKSAGRAHVVHAGSQWSMPLSDYQNFRSSRSWTLGTRRWPPVWQVGQSRRLRRRHDSSLRNIHVAVTASPRPVVAEYRSSATQVPRGPLQLRLGVGYQPTRFVLEWNIPAASAQESPISKLRIAIECSRSGASDATAGRRPLDGRDLHWD